MSSPEEVIEGNENLQWQHYVKIVVQKKKRKKTRCIIYLWEDFIRENHHKIMTNKNYSESNRLFSNKLIIHKNYAFKWNCNANNILTIFLLFKNKSINY